MASVVNLRQKESMMFLIRDKRFDTALMNGNQMCFIRGTYITVDECEHQHYCHLLQSRVLFLSGLMMVLSDRNK